MIILLWLLFLLQVAHAGKISEEENSKLKERCRESVVAPNMYKRYRADHSKYPFAVALSYIHANGSHSEPFCSGVLISYRHILTAAHCLIINQNYACNQSRYTGQLHLQEWTAQEIGVLLPSKCSTAQCWHGKDIHRVASAHWDRNYDNVNEACMNTTSYDIGVVELEEDVRGPPICMPQADDDIRQNTKSIGYGPYNHSVEVDGRSMQVEDRSMQVVVYHSVEKRPGEEFALMAYTENRNESTISGDSGGPLLQYLNGKYYLVGITSTSTNPDPDPAKKVEVVGYFVDVRKKLDWICDETGVCALTGSGESKQPPSEEEESS